MPADRLRRYVTKAEAMNLLTGEMVPLRDGLLLDAYCAVWLDIS